VHYFHIFIPLIALFINSLSQVAFFRVLPRIGLLKSLFIGFLTGLVYLIAAEIILFKVENQYCWEKISMLLSNGIIYFFLWYCYFNFVNMGETARRIRIITELYYAPEGLTTEEILERYNAEAIIQKRLTRLIHNKQVIIAEGRYKINSLLLLSVAKVLVLMKSIVFGKKRTRRDYNEKRELL
jgi:hypothetical protein